jgi:predicted phage terminase large subunit-like protein
MNALDELNDRQKNIIKCFNDCEYFTKYVLDLECKDFHKEWIDAFENNRFTVLLAPRGHGKTSIVGSYIIWRIVRDRNIRILLVTINQDKANDMMSFIKTHLSENTKLKDLFGEYKGFGEWSASKIKVKDSRMKDPTVKTLGVGSRIISGHYDLIVLDDITDDENSRTESRREKLEDWYNGPLVGTFLSDTKVINIGTRWQQDDFHSYLMKKAGYKSMKYKALLNEEDVIDGKKAKVLWPEHLPWDKDMIKEYNLPEDTLTLQFIREHQGERYFQMQYQNNIIATGISTFKEEWLEKSIKGFKYLEGIYPADMKKYVGVDFGGSEDKSDYFSLTVIGTSKKEGNIYVLKNIRTHASLHRQIEIIKDIDDNINPSRIGIEAVAQQKIITDDLIKDNPTLPIIPIKSSIVNDRETRMDRLSILFETNRILLNPSCEHLVSELRVYPRGSHDDTIDSLSFAIQASHEGGIIDWSRTKDIISTKSGGYSFKKI